ncbi:MAG: D-hexose-6-phosphate mutarotase [Oceanospirillaceae bacterium]|nr:D-hexose-6-phosphate mutarotase [Oceanospirillaceae bacterium]
MSEQFTQSQGIHEIRWLGCEVWLIIEPWGELVISKLGAQVLHYQPAGQSAVFWLNKSSGPLCQKQSALANNTDSVEAIRAGAPLCWPWFGPHESDESQPNHGFARIANWQLVNCVLQGDSTKITKLQFSPISELYAGLTLMFELEISDQQLTMKLVTTNVSDQPQPLTQAIHSYFLVGDSEKVTVSGLKGCEYIDKLADNSLGKQRDELAEIKAIDSIYKHTGDVVVIDPVLKRKLHIRKEQSGSTVVWNPGSMAKSYDILADHRAFVCVEAANTAHEGLVLAANQRVTLMQSVKVES